MTSTTDSETESTTATAQLTTAEPDSRTTTASGPPKIAVSFRLRTLVVISTILLALVVAATFAVLWLSARADLAANDRQTAADSRAEQVATDYAVGAATVDYQSFADWTVKLKQNTTPALASKFDATAPKLEEILAPLKWTSTASVIAAKLMSHDANSYKVNVFLDVTSTNAQNPNGSKTTVTYTVTIDSAQQWRVTDVGGMDGALAPAGN